MPRRNPNRRRKQSRKIHSQEPSFDRADHYQQYNNFMYADGDVLAAACFSEDSIRRQLEYTIPPPQQINGDITPRWRTGYWYTYTHPVTREDVVVWISGGDLGFTHGYGYEYAGEEEHYRNEDYAIDAGLCDEESATCQDIRKSAELPLFGYREGYHDRILKDQAEDWWSLFGHDVPKQFILGAESTQKVEKEWNVAAYFAPYRTPKQESCPRSERQCRDGKESALRKSEESGNELSIGEVGGGIPRACRRRDGWECDFCGVECFCWTVEAGMTEIW
ncbi:hypothetical protein AG0111_0g8933 [Alternaria gaisen]|uniref:Uncharacterized protein n=1 Tax=Alternaria gaisen TaxID=167740 RepID=A0ACB6FDK0_9PLEO|nr:hypothetical protein AG0111_0g8933 [Alternaria gaisen]